MNIATYSLDKVRSLASALHTNRRHGSGRSEHVDRDLVRESHELYLLAQSRAPRMF
ncbi:hypothetical protein GCM10023168_06630 [Fodinibacter luteus]|uniref:Uncharacterized protein n=1 Tax=Fodinibacter luteus TaxID=552064 RepID=A0ABP8K2P1_9MICO